MNFNTHNITMISTLQYKLQHNNIYSTTISTTTVSMLQQYLHPARSLPLAAITPFMAGAEYNHEMHLQTIQSFPPPTPFGTLIIIPVELRLKIYRALIERGQVAIFRASRAVQKEAFADFFKHAIYRLKIDYSSWFTLYPIKLPCNSIQNVELHLEPNHRGITHFNSWLQRFIPDKTDVKTCEIRLDFAYNFVFMPEDFFAISALTAFPKVIFVIAGVNRDTIPSMRAFANCRRSDLDRDQYHIMRYDVPEDDMLAYEGAVRFLERTLGSTECFEDDGGMRLLFHPRRSPQLPSSERKDAKAQAQD